MKKELTLKQKKADKDLNVILCATLVPLIIYIVFGNKIMNFVKISDVNIWLKFIPILLIQFGLAGFGSLIVMIYRKEKFKDYGLCNSNLMKTILLSFLVCIPALIFMIANNEVKSYLPFQSCFMTDVFLNNGFPNNILGYLLTAIVWGFLEGFNYVVISKKINDRYPSKNRWVNYGAIVCAVVCILIHGMIGFDLHTIVEMATTFIIIYGMLIVKENTSNAWGCILIFFLFWNAF